MATKFGRKNPRPKCNALLGSKVMQGSVLINQRSNCLEICKAIYNVANATEHYAAAGALVYIKRNVYLAHTACHMFYLIKQKCNEVHHLVHAHQSFRRLVFVFPLFKFHQYVVQILIK